MGAGCQRATDPEEEEQGGGAAPAPAPARERSGLEAEQGGAGLAAVLSAYLEHHRCVGCRARCRQRLDKAGSKSVLRKAIGEASVREELDLVSHGKRRAAPESPASSSTSRSRTPEPSRSRSAADPNAEISVFIVSRTPEHDVHEPYKDDSMRSVPWMPQAIMPMMLGVSGDPVQVTLNIYDIGKAPHVQLVNTCLRTLGTGLFHCGLEVYEAEWSYAATKNGDGSGVFCSLPRECELQTFRESVVLGETKFSVKGVQQLLQVLQDAWPACDYDVLGKNCCHFCDCLSRRLGAGPVPGRVLSLAEAAARTARAWDALCCRAAAEAGLACAPAP